MSEHKYSIGKIITFHNDDRTRAAANGHYRIVALRPPIDGEPCYVVKSDLERHDRVVSESDLR